MRTSNNGISFIKQFEGCSYTAYKCPAGIWTVGYGHTGGGIKQGTKITAAQATELLIADLLAQNQFDALVSHVYNCGVSKFATPLL